MSKVNYTDGDDSPMPIDPFISNPPTEEEKEYFYKRMNEFPTEISFSDCGSEADDKYDEFKLKVKYEILQLRLDKHHPRTM